MTGSDGRGKPANFIAAWRKFRGIDSQGRLAELSGINRATINRLESGKLPYHQWLLEKLAVALNCRQGDLIDTDPFETAKGTGPGAAIPGGSRQRVVLDKTTNRDPDLSNIINLLEQNLQAAARAEEQRERLLKLTERIETLASDDALRQRQAQKHTHTGAKEAQPKQNGSGSQTRPARELMNAQEVAEFFGVNFHTVYRWIRRGKFPPPIKLAGGRSSRWRRSDCERILQEMSERDDGTPVVIPPSVATSSAAALANADDPLLRKVSLHAWMTERGHDDQYVAEKVGITRTQVSRIRRGVHGTSMRVAMKLEELTGIKYWRFLSPPAVRQKRRKSPPAQ